MYVIFLAHFGSSGPILFSQIVVGLFQLILLLLRKPDALILALGWRESSVGSVRCSYLGVCREHCSWLHVGR